MYLPIPTLQPGLSLTTAIEKAQGLRPGGFGLLLAKKLVDELIYSQQGNEVLLVKYVDPPLSQANSIYGPPAV